MRSAARARALPLLFLLSSTLTTACLTTERPAVTDSARLTSGPLAVPPSGEWQDGDEHLTYTAAVRDSLTEVTELLTYGSDGTGTRTFSLDARGRLRRFRETRRQVMQAPDRSPTPLQVELDLTFLDDSLVTSTKRVDGADAQLRPYEVSNARSHARAFLERFAPAVAPPPEPNRP